MLSVQEPMKNALLKKSQCPLLMWFMNFDVSSDRFLLASTHFFSRPCFCSENTSSVISFRKVFMPSRNASTRSSK